MSSFYQQTAEEAARLVNMRQSRAAQGRRYNSIPTVLWYHLVKAWHSSQLHVTIRQLPRVLQQNETN
jgi:hypothetical protein